MQDLPARDQNDTGAKIDTDEEEQIHKIGTDEQSQELDHSLDRHLARLEGRVDDDELNTGNDYKPRNPASRGNTSQEEEQERPARGRGGRGNRAQDTETKEQSSAPMSRGNRNPVPEEQAKKLDQSAWDQSKDEQAQEKPEKEASQKSDGEIQKDDNKILDQSNWDEEQDGTPKKQSEAQSKPSGRSGRTPVPQIQTKKPADDQSVWDSGDDKKEKEEPVARNGRNKPKKDDQQNQLEPDKINASNWDNSKEEEKEKPSEEPENNRGRGNRGNRGNRDDDQEENNGFGGNRGGRGNRDFNGNGFPARNYDNGGFNRDGGRGGFRGRGGFNRGNREQGGGFNRGNREQGGGFNRGNREQGGGFNRGNRQQGGFNRGNRQQGGFNRNRYDENRPFARRQGGGFNRNFENNNENSRGGPNFNNNDQQSNPINSTVKTQPPVYEANMVIEPKGLESWPEVSLYVKKCKVSLTLRSINQHQADAIVFPVQDMNFKLYPSVLINADDKYNYRAKIQERFTTDHWSKSCAYRKPCNGMGEFKDVVFCKVDTSKDIDYKELIMTLIKYTIMEPKCESLVFPICKELKDFKKMLSVMMECLIVMSEHKKCFLKRVEFSTKDTDLFKECAGVFMEKISEDIEANKIYIQ